MEEQTTNIIKVITTIENENKSYSIDIDDTLTFYEFKKILSGAARLLKNTYHIFHEGQEYTNEYDYNTMKEIFPDLKKIINLTIKVIKDIDENDYIAFLVIKVYVLTVLIQLKSI